MNERIDPTKKYEFEFNDTDKRTLRTFYTLGLSKKIRDFILDNKSKSYLEVGCGFGGVMLRAGKALSMVNGKNYVMVGYDMKDHRLNYAKQLLERFGIKARLVLGSVHRVKIEERFDVLFIDCGYQVNQKLLDSLSDIINQGIFLHDVIKGGSGDVLVPDGFNIEYFPRDKAALVTRKK